MSIATKVSAISHDYVCEVFSHTVTGEYDGISTYSSYGRGAMHGPTPLIAEMRALATAGFDYDWSPFIDEVLRRIEAVLPDLGRFPALEAEIDDLILSLKTDRGRRELGLGA